MARELAPGFLGFGLDPARQGLAGVVRIEADVELRPGDARNDVGGGVRHVDAGDLQVRRLELGIALVELALLIGAPVITTV